MFRIPLSASHLVLTGAALLTSLGLPAAAQAITRCHDYTSHRVWYHVRDKQRINPNDTTSEGLRAMLKKLGYTRVGNFTGIKLSKPGNAGYELVTDNGKLDGIAHFLKPGDVIILIGVDHSGFVNANGKIDHFLQELNQVGVRLMPQSLPTDEQVRLRVWKELTADPGKKVHATIHLLRDKYQPLLNRKELPNKTEFGWFGGLSRGDSLREMVSRADKYPLLTGIEVWRGKPKAPEVKPPSAGAGNVAGLWRDDVGREIRIAADGNATCTKLPGRPRDNSGGWKLNEQVFRNFHPSFSAIDFTGTRLSRGPDQSAKWEEATLTLQADRNSFSMYEKGGKYSSWTRIGK